MADWFVVFGLVFAVLSTVVSAWAFIKQIEADRDRAERGDE